ncbi:hypothetical protein AOL_s00004g466 [Orbilia oligospora ATCC 24927]|uniref:Probable vacuolar protein sorting-associated protein 16 homolog n=1 Tax=Arthrobotrys oligospora (strain ATCC 24927 / CBS 115.81 / DSM 1491) TaxID=756982 RepID=G1WYV5_ARTOA|nr:hypothetical protein AOL_s00004g466 [Orbilia oligospora ATCC 24927]EGX53807.1 hypothetical protein AOL_s00004g466 [Orbilia oligospora ATCC 24927]
MASGLQNPPSTWELVSGQYYRKFTVFTPSWTQDEDFDLDDYLVAGAPFGGAIALWKDPRKFHAYQGGQAAKPNIMICNLAGALLRRITWDRGAIQSIGWSDDEHLLVVTTDGSVRCYYDLQGNFTQFSLGADAEEHGVVSCRFWGTGFVALLSNNVFVAVNRYDEPRPRPLALPKLPSPESKIHSWALIPPNYSDSRHVEVIMATDQTILIVDATESQDQILQNGPFHHISVSPNGSYVALYTGDGKVWVIDVKFQQKLSEYDSGKLDEIPLDVQWCGIDSVVLVWEDEVHMVGPAGAALRWYYDSRVNLVPEMDGIRMITTEKCEFLQRVPDVTKSIFEFGSSSPPAGLLEAVGHLERKSPKADDAIQLIRPSLPEAVAACVQAAGHEFDVDWQKQLLKAASFGKSVLELYNSDDFVEMCKKLRVLNAVRFYEIGFGITADQLERLTPDKLIERLVARQEHLLALRISDYLNLPTDKIYIHWACMKVKLSLDDEDTICRTIVMKLSGKRGIAFDEIAKSAFEEGRGRLATQLLNYEPRAGRQVPLLMSMEEDEIALDKAIESMDSDLVFYVLLHLKKKLPIATFFRIINDRPLAYSLIETSARNIDTELLKDLYYQDDRKSDGANVILKESLMQENFTTRIDKLKLASKLLKDSKEHALDSSALEESIKLLTMQESLERDVFEETFVGLSLNDTIFKLTRLGFHPRANKIRSEFKMPDKRFWWIKLRGLVAKREWAEIEEWSKLKTSPIGWEPFFNECLSAGNTKVASIFIPKCKNLGYAERVNMWVQCGMIVKAGEEALLAKDYSSLEGLLPKATGAAVPEIQKMMQKLRPGR